MATTVAHGLVGVMVYCSVRPLTSAPNRLPLTVVMLVVAAFVANIPDLDMILSLLLYGDHRVLHGGASHSLLFAVFGGFILKMMSRKSLHRTQLALTVALLLASHVVVDNLTGPNIGIYPTYGTPAFWPLIDSRISLPVTLFKGIEHSKILPGGLITAIWELVVLLPITVWVVLFSRKKYPCVDLAVKSN